MLNSNVFLQLCVVFQPVRLSFFVIAIFNWYLFSNLDNIRTLNVKAMLVTHLCFV